MEVFVALRCVALRCACLLASLANRTREPKIEVARPDWESDPFAKHRRHRRPSCAGRSSSLPLLHHSDNMSLPVKGRSALTAAARLAVGTRSPIVQLSRAFTSAPARYIGVTPEDHVKGAKSNDEQFPNMRVHSHLIAAYQKQGH